MKANTVYKYKGMSKAGDKVSGKFSGSREELHNKLKSQGVLLLQVSEINVKLKAGSFNESDFLSAIEQLYHLIVSGMRLDMAIQTMMDSLQKDNAEKYWAFVLAEIKQGTLLSVALAQATAESPGWKIPQLYSQIISVGEEIGDLPAAFKRLLEHLEFRKSLKSELISSLSYPAFLLVMSVVSIAIVVLVIVPRFVTVFDPDQINDLPMISRIVFSLGGLSGASLQGVLVFCLIAAFLLWFFRDKVIPLASKGMVNSLHLFPLTRSSLQHLDLADIYTALGSMLEGGVGLHHSLIQAAGTARLPALTFLLEQTATNVKEGQSIHDLWRSSSLVPAVDVALIAVGESSANLGSICLKLGARHMEQFRLTVRGIMALFEPAMIVCLGCAIGSIVTGILLAVLSMTDMAGM